MKGPSFPGEVADIEELGIRYLHIAAISENDQILNQEARLCCTSNGNAPLARASSSINSTVDRVGGIADVSISKPERSLAQLAYQTNAQPEYRLCHNRWCASCLPIASQNGASLF